MELKNNMCVNEILSIDTIQKEGESFIDYLDVDDLTLKTYRVGILAFLKYLKDNNIKEPNRNDIISFRNMLRDNYSSNTVNTYMIAVRSLFKYLSLNGKYKNIAEDIKGARYSKIPKKEVLSVEELQTIYNNLTDLRERCLFGLMISTGLRVCEISTALIEDIRIHNGEPVLFVLGKKRDSKCEYVKLSQKVLKDLQEYIGNRTEGNIFISTSNNNKNGGLTTTALRSIVKGIFRRFGIDKDTISCHSLRRSFAVVSYESGSSIYDIQQVLHHESISTTTRYLKQVDRDKNKTELNVSNILLGNI